jgi:molybdopterin converting factor small subunit
MRIRAEYFGALRAKLARESDWLDLAPGSTALDLGRAATASMGRDWLPALRFAVNDVMAPPDAALADGDRVALLPPMSGG